MAENFKRPATSGRTTAKLAELREQAAHCTACTLYKRATQTVFGEGPQSAKVMMVGEQPGDREDLKGRPFVGPAGAVLDKALAAVGMDREQVYVTNIVKHFKWEARGKRRIHKKSSAIEISACRPWLESEIAAVQPQVTVLLGATAAQSILGRQFLVTKHRGQWVPSNIAPYVLATVHPSSILRAPDDESRRQELQGLIEDLKPVAELIKKRAAA